MGARLLNLMRAPCKTLPFFVLMMRQCLMAAYEGPVHLTWLVVVSGLVDRE